MGGRFSDTNKGGDRELNYDELYDLRRQLFPDIHDDNLLRSTLRDKVRDTTLHIEFLQEKPVIAKYLCIGFYSLEIYQCIALKLISH